MDRSEEDAATEERDHPHKKRSAREDWSVGLWLDGSGKTDWSQTHIHLETSAAFAVIYSAEHGAYAMYLGVDKGDLTQRQR